MEAWTISSGRLFPERGVFTIKGIVYIYIYCEKSKVHLTMMWSLQLHISDHLHVVIKECAHKCNPYFDPISVSKGKAQLYQYSGN